jgi:pyrrolysine biosynthesis protein PylD
MTRLRAVDIEDIGAELKSYDLQLKAKTGCTLLEIACHAAGVRKGDIDSLISATKIGVLPLSCGQGLIKGFGLTVGAILKHLGFAVQIAQNSDATGLAELFEHRPQVLMTSDDSRFIALNFSNHRVVDNSSATAEGFVAGLDLMVGGLRGKKALVLGCGPVGSASVYALLQFGAQVSVLDRKESCARNLQKEILFDNKIRVLNSKPEGLRQAQVIIEATNSADTLSKEDITAQTYVAAPGMPLGVESAARNELRDRLLHDPLQIGVAVMGVRSII